MYSDEEFERFLDEKYPLWNSEMITPGFEFDQTPLRQIDGPLATAARNLSQDDLRRTGFIEKKNKRGKTVRYTLSFIHLGELDAFQLAVRSFCNEVSYIQCNVKKDQFLNLIPDAVEDFEFDLFVALKVGRLAGDNCCL